MKTFKFHEEVRRQTLSETFLSFSTWKEASWRSFVVFCFCLTDWNKETFIIFLIKLKTWSNFPKKSSFLVLFARQFQTSPKFRRKLKFVFEAATIKLWDFVSRAENLFAASAVSAVYSHSAFDPSGVNGAKFTSQDSLSRFRRMFVQENLLWTLNYI